MIALKQLLLALACVAWLVPGVQGLRAGPDDLDAAFGRFWTAKDPSAAARSSTDIVKIGVPFEQVYERLRQGRPYTKELAVGTVTGRRAGLAGEFGYTLEIPEGYDPAKRYQVRFQLHGGVNRSASAPRRTGGIGRLAGAEQIYIMPQAWDEAPWWTDEQIANMRGILDLVKRSYNVDESHVAVAGVSDGGTGAYYVAMRDPTPYSSFLPLNGSLVVLTNTSIGVKGDLFPTNLRNKPFFIVNGGRDPLYPIAAVEPYVQHLSSGGVPVLYRPQPSAGHDTSWWLQEKDAFEAFVRDHPRVPLPDRITWETSDTRASGRVHWLVIDSLGSRAGDARPLPDLNDIAPPKVVDFGVRMDGLKVDQVVGGSNADRIGLKRGDTIVRIDDRPVSSGRDIVLAFQGHAIGSPIRFTVSRAKRETDLPGTFEPTEMKSEPTTTLFRHTSRSGRVDLERTGNTVNATTRGVAEFTLLLSPDQFDFSKPVKVVTNGTVAFEGTVEKSVATLMKWAARDNDRTMLFGAELKVKVR
jgi:poly(3-hydroxybutyrate) depolymerase